MELEYLKKLAELNDECRTDLLKEFPKEILAKIRTLKMNAGKQNPSEKSVESVKRMDSEICKLMESYVDENYDLNEDEEETPPIKKQEDEKIKTVNKPTEKPVEVPKVQKTQPEIEQAIIQKINSNPKKRISKEDVEKILGNPVSSRGDVTIGTLRLSKVLFSDSYYL